MRIIVLLVVVAFMFALLAGAAVGDAINSNLPGALLPVIAI